MTILDRIIDAITAHDEKALPRPADVIALTDEQRHQLADEIDELEIEGTDGMIGSRILGLTVCDIDGPIVIRI